MSRTRFTLTQPCTHCPFRSDRDPYLRPERAQEIADDLRRGDWFACHKTCDYDDDGEGAIGSRARACAGALITMERADEPNNAMRVAERLGLYDHTRLDMDAPVHDGLDAWVSAHTAPTTQPTESSDR